MSDNSKKLTDTVIKTIRNNHRLVRIVDGTSEGTVHIYQNEAWQPWPEQARRTEIDRLLGYDSSLELIGRIDGLLSLRVPTVHWEDTNQLLTNHTEPHLCFTNGLLNVMRGELEENRPEHYTTIQIPHDWNPNADTEQALAYLSGIGVQDYTTLLELTGLCLAAKPLKNFFVLHGPSNTGKTTFLLVLKALVGRGNCCTVSLYDLAQRFGAAGLEGKLVAQFDDLDANYISKTGQIKSLTGESPTFRVEHKYHTPYEAPLYATLVFSCNEIPPTADKTEAWLNRMVIVPFDKVIPKEQQKRFYAESLTNHDLLSGLLKLSVTQGLRTAVAQDWQLADFEFLTEANRRYQKINDPVESFLDECYTQEAEGFVKRSDLYRRYRSYCQLSQYKALGRNSFYDRLEEKGFVTTKREGVRGYKGISPDYGWNSI